jgi:hypothetical protein
LRFLVITIFSLLLLSPTGFAQERPSFVIGDKSIPPGEKMSTMLNVPAGQDEATKIPITVFHGRKSGPVLALVAGVHGYEYSPIIALQRILPQLDVNNISGTLIIVHIANMPSFLRRTIYYSPIDGKNLNRVFPGKRDGTVTERIAYVLTKEVIERSDYFVDIHCGDGNESLSPYLAYYVDAPNQELVTRADELAKAFGIMCIKQVSGRPRDPNAAVYSTNAAMLRGKVTFAVESGELGKTEHKPIAAIEKGVINILRKLKMIDGEVEKFDNHLIIDSEESVRSTVQGIFYPLLERGQPVSKGMLLGYVTDFFGNRILDVRSPITGVILYMMATPPINEGETLASVGQISDRSQK